MPWKRYINRTKIIMVVVASLMTSIVMGQEKSNAMFGVKTNLVYLSGLLPDFNHYTVIPNLELEWYIANQWSVAGSGAYAKWKAGKNKFFGISSWSLEPRFWLKNDGRHESFYLGAYGQIGDFDNQRKHIDDFGNTGTFWSTGISAGFVFPLTDYLFVEAGLRGGYLNREIKVYSEEGPNYYYDYTKHKNKWGLTGIKLSIMYRFGKK